MRRENRHGTGEKSSITRREDYYDLPAFALLVEVLRYRN